MPSPVTGRSRKDLNDPQGQARNQRMAISSTWLERKG